MSSTTKFRSGLVNDTLEHFDYSAKGIPFERSIDEIIDKTQGTEPDLIKTFQDNGLSTITVQNEYGTMTMTVISVEEEIRRVSSIMEKRQIAYKYYSTIWFVCAILLCFFITAGISKLIGPITSIVGSVLSTIGIVGAIIDWKGWFKQHANESFNQ